MVPVEGKSPVAFGSRIDDPSDGKLVTAAVGGDRDAFSELASRHRRAVVRTAASIVGRNSAEDVAQDALLLAFRALSTLRDRTKFRRWLLTITRFRALRVGRLEGKCNIVQLDSGALETLSDLACLPRENLAGDDLLREAIETIPSEYAEVIRLHYLHGLPQKRIAELLGVTLSLIKWRCSKGKELIRKLVRRERTLVARIDATCAMCASGHGPGPNSKRERQLCSGKAVKKPLLTGLSASVLAALLLLGSGLCGAAPVDDCGVPDDLDDGMSEDAAPATGPSQPSAQRLRVRTLARYAVPNVKLIDQAARRVSLPELLGGDSPVVLNFFFASCSSICPIMTSTLSQMRKELGRETGALRMVSVTIDPDQDTPEVLRGYAKTYSAGKGWSFLTGDADKILEVQRAFGADTGGKFNHRLLYFFRAAGSMEWVRVEGQASAADLAAEVRALRSAGPAPR